MKKQSCQSEDPLHLVESAAEFLGGITPLNNPSLALERATAQSQGW